MPEVPLVGEDDRHSMLVGSGYNVFVPHRSAGFHDPDYTGTAEQIDAVAERKEAV
jgi:hypothetical protein